MDLDHDDLAGVLDLFGGLTRAELDRALEELAFRAGDAGAVPGDDVVETAVEAFAVVRYEREDGPPLLVPGPTAFPTIPDHGEDLPHLLDVDRRRIDRASLGDAAVDRFRSVAATAVAEGDEERIAELLDLSYELEAWAPVDVAPIRDRLDAAIADDGSNG